MSEKGQANFADQIDDAIDELFTARRAIEIDPLTNEVKELAGAEDAAPQPAPEDRKAENSPSADSLPQPRSTPAWVDSPPESESKGKTAEDKPGGQLNLLLKRLDQTFLSLDWEVSKTGTDD
ncbi:MAG TPA: hypothetical protein ENK33_11355, partial [Desulfobacterales bacterium]|nr:hypothetical protein [Desulfobacterales bacterium]